MSAVEPCSKIEREFFTGLLREHARVTRDVQMAFTAFCHAHGLDPNGASLDGVSEHGLMVTRREPVNGQAVE